MPSAQTASNPKAELQDINGFKVADIGRDVIVNGIGSGVIRFVGLHAANGEPLVGVEYNKPKGKHNGTLQGVHYFECDADKGTLASPSNVTFNDGPDRRSTITSAPAFNGRADVGEHVTVQSEEAAPKKGWKAFSGNVASKLKGVSNVAGKMKGAITKRATAATGDSSASPPLPNVPPQQQMNPLPLPPTVTPEADQGNFPSNESSTDGTDHATANEAYHAEVGEYQFATATPQDGGIIKASNSVLPPMPAGPLVHQQPLVNYRYTASAAPPPVHQQPLAHNASDVLPPMHQQSLERTLAGGGVDGDNGAVWAAPPPVAPLVFVPPPAHRIDVRTDDCGLNGQGIKFGFYRSTAKGAQATMQKQSSYTGDKSGAATTERGESILATIRSTDGIGSTKGGHVVEVRHADNGSDGATYSVSCCDGCCGGGDALASAYRKGSETHKFSTAEIAYVKLNAVDEFDLNGNDNLGCFGNFCRKCFPSIYYCSQKWCSCICGWCSPDGALFDGTEKVLLRIGLQHADKEEIRIEYDKTNFTADEDDSDHPRCCWCCDGKPCKPWKVRQTAVSKRMLADGTELRTSTWTEEEAPPTCCCFRCCYECEHNCCGVPRVTESFVTKEKYHMDAALKETYEVANNDMESFASILSHLAAQATSFE